MHTLANELQRLADRLQRLDRRAPIVGAMPALTVRYPLLARLAPDAVARVTCYACLGDGTALHADAADLQWPCQVCGGSGLQCPICRGKRWLRTSVPAADARSMDALIQRCPDCATVAYETEAIVGFIEQQSPVVAL